MEPMFWKKFPWRWGGSRVHRFLVPDVFCHKVLRTKFKCRVGHGTGTQEHTAVVFFFLFEDPVWIGASKTHPRAAYTNVIHTKQELEDISAERNTQTAEQRAELCWFYASTSFSARGTTRKIYNKLKACFACVPVNYFSIHCDVFCILSTWKQFSCEKQRLTLRITSGHLLPTLHCLI